MTTRIPLADLLAGLSIAGLLLPEAVAYSGVANLPPQAGVVALFAGLIGYGLIGRSRYAIVTATSSSAAVLASAMVALGASDVAQRLTLAAALVVGTGVAFLLAAALRLGAISTLIARPVLRGYAFGLAVVIAVRQWPHLVNMPVHSSGFFALRGGAAARLRGLGTAEPAVRPCGPRRTVCARTRAAPAGCTRRHPRQHRRRGLPRRTRCRPDRSHSPRARAP